MLKKLVLIPAVVVAASLSATAYAKTVTVPPELGNYPERPVRLVVPFPAGGTVDGLARALGPELSKQIGQSVVIENRGGAGGSLGAAQVARAAPDGYTLLLALDTHALNPLVYKDLPYDNDKDFAPISLIARAPMVAVANKDFEPKDIKSFVAYAKAHPGEINFASVGAGSSGHLTGEMFNQLADVSMVHVPYRGGAPLMTDLLGGRVHMTWGTVPYVSAMVKAGNVHALGQAGAKRSKALPDVPTVAEQGFKGLEVYGWVGILAPAGASDAMLQFWHQALSQAVEHPDVAKSL